MPLEAIAEDDYSCKSDVYSYAVTVWEIFSRGELPFTRMSDQEVLSSIERGELHWKHHKTTPESLKHLLTKCCESSPRDRPTFSQIAVQVGDSNLVNNV